MVREVASNVVNRDSAGGFLWFVNVSTLASLLKLDHRAFTHPAQVVLECSIPAILDDDDQAKVRSHLQCLRDLGFRIALEPDGKQRYNGALILAGCADYIKTSPTLLAALMDHNSSALKGNAVYWLEQARQNHLGVIGFGLECMKQLNTLVMLDVHFAQGYSLQRPVPVYNGRRQQED
jgi:EAL domain-containing protein (putative c-di-GMP-specific phosphodiesterase class I)